MHEFTVFVSRPDWLDRQTGTGVNMWPIVVEAENPRDAAYKAVEEMIEDDIQHGWISEEEAYEEYSNYQSQIVLTGVHKVALWGWEI
jgi:ABC-type glycerol-3-phosphate transport system substrate-binding protein